ncbi:MAG: energy-coupled thiamine transporter ThiT [Synergistaceae bacterium]|nr:energy-coupled thiamine transporter ThiT [Synergistaceae bacterium]MBQ3398485.1 energy-coupled thiamine transporter ThiT [Synergistaceae bacterium]MBQ6981671.1 energy-coupled thiamine transporter ThiT [Synergistaceae bacterium]
MPSRHTNTVAMVECALCIALSFVLTKVNLFTMPQGGSVDFELVPLILFTYRRGWKWGLIAGTMEGVLRILLGAYFLNVAQVILDYPLAYSFVGLTDLHPFWLGLIAAWAGMIASSVVSGAIFFAQYAPEGQNPWVYSLFYNAPVLGAKYIVSGIAAFILWKILERDLTV